MKKLSVLSLSLILGACGGGGGSDTAVADATMVVTPSLGKFSLGTAVKLKKPDGTVISSGTIGTTGSATLTVGSYTGPVVIEVLGAAASGSTAKVTYYDERDGSTQDFGAGEVLRAAVPTPQTQVGVTALTNASVAKLEVLTGNLTGIDASKINDANAKVAAAFGLPDILVAPKPVDGTTGATLNLATPADKYALVLAALAKTGGANNAGAVAKTLAADLSDGILDGQQKKFGDTVAVAVPAPAYVPATVVTDLSTHYNTAATTFADDSSKLVIANQPLVVTPNVTTVVAQSNQSDINLAKAMFAELRTTLKSFVNGNKTGFLDTQAQRANDDLAANVAPALEKVANRIGALGDARKMFEDATAYTINNTSGLVPGLAPATSGAPNALVRQTGLLSNMWNGIGSFQYCWTDSTTGVTSKVSCSYAGKDSADRDNGRIKFVVYELTSPATNQYTYTATRYNRAVTFPDGVMTLGALTAADTVPVGSGTFNGTATTFALSGTLPPSASNSTGTLLTGVDTIAMTGARETLSTNNYRYNLTGSVSTINATDPNKAVTVSLETGSYLDQDESNAGTTGKLVTAAKLVGIIKTNATRFAGTLEMGSFSSDATGQNRHATSLTFTGSMRDTSTGGAGQILTGNLVAAVTGYSSYNPFAAQTGDNYRHGTLTFIGAVKAPERPLMTLILGVTKTGTNTNSATVSYSYGTKAITGSGTSDDTNSANNTMTLSNQDGIQFVTKTGIASKSGTTVATLLNGNIAYTDGVTESLQ